MVIVIVAVAADDNDADGGNSFLGVRTAEMSVWVRQSQDRDMATPVGSLLWPWKLTDELRSYGT